MKTAQRTGAVAMAVFEFFVLSEILWYYLHDGEQTLHEAFGEYLRGFKERARHARGVERTLNMIRDLPEK